MRKTGRMIGRNAVLGLMVLALGACTYKTGGPGSASDIIANGEDIPPRFQGVWDYEGGSCSPESDARMTVGVDEIWFYESIGKVSGIQPDGEDVIITLDMEGEGEKWTDTVRLALAGTGKATRLHAVFAPSEGRISNFPRKHCLP